MLFAILVSYVTNYWAQNQVHHNVSTFFQNKMAGRSLSLGEHSPGFAPPEVWAPLYSAPGYNDVKATLKLPARVYGLPTGAATSPTVRQQKIDVSSSLIKDEVSFTELDPIFVRPLDVSGMLNPSRPTTLRVKQLGEPIIDSFWEK